MRTGRAIGLMTVLAVSTVVVMLRPDRTLVEAVAFRGHARATVGELRHMADVRNGTRWWEVDRTAIAERVEHHPWVATATVDLQFPATLVVTVTEHEPVGLVTWNDRLYYVDAHGEPFLEARSDLLDLPLYTGLAPSLEARHPDLPRLVLRDAMRLVDELDTRGLVSRSGVSEVRFSETRGYTLWTTGAYGDRRTARLLFGVGDYDRQLRHLELLVGRGIDLTEPLHVDLAPRTVAIVRPLDAEIGDLDG